VGITELDDSEGYRAILDALRKEKAPVGIVETLLVESIALDMVRVRRARRLEAEYITSKLNPPIYGPSLLGDDLFVQGAMLDPGLPAAISSEIAQPLVSVFQRYESTFLMRILRFLHELERLQRMRSGERLPAPAVVDVSVHAETRVVDSVNDDTRIGESVPAETGSVDSAPTELGQPKALRCGERLPAPDAVDVSVHAERVANSAKDDTLIVDSVPAETGSVDSAPTVSGQPKALPGDEE
jgi:hypothetical protein